MNRSAGPFHPFCGFSNWATVSIDSSNGEYKKNLPWKEQPASLVAILSFKTELGNRNLQTKIRICSIFQFPVPLFCFSGRVRHSLKISVWAKCENQSSGRTARVSLDWTHFQTHKTLHKSVTPEKRHSCQIFIHVFALQCNKAGESHRSFPIAETAFQTLASVSRLRT